MPSKIRSNKQNFSHTIVAFRAGFVWLLALLLWGAEALPAFAQNPQALDPSAVETQVKKFGPGSR